MKWKPTYCKLYMHVSTANKIWLIDSRMYYFFRSVAQKAYTREYLSQPLMSKFPLEWQLSYKGSYISQGKNMKD